MSVATLAPEQTEDKHLKVNIVDPSGTVSTPAKLPKQVPVSKLATALAMKFNLPTTDPRGVLIEYRLSYVNGISRELPIEQSLQEAGIKAQDTLRLHSEMQAG
jgi:hypothetical protein